MAMAALAARMVEVIADLGPSAGARYRYGSGCIVRGRTVLTAAHVVADAVSVAVRDPARREYTATWTRGSWVMRTAQARTWLCWR